MPLIEPENKKRPQKICISLTHDAYEELSRYCRFLESSCDHVMGALVMQVLPKDRDFQTWKSTPHASAMPGEVIKTDRRGRKKLSEPKAPAKAISAA